MHAGHAIVTYHHRLLRTHSAAHLIEPEALPLERIPRQWNLAQRTTLVEFLPIKVNALRVEPAGSSEQLPPLAASSTLAHRRNQPVIRDSIRLRQRQQLRLCAEFDKHVHAGCVSRCKAALELHRLSQMTPPVSGVDRLLPLDGKPSQIRNPPDLRYAEVDLGRLRFKGLQHRLKCIRVEAMRRAQSLMPQTFEA